MSGRAKAKSLLEAARRDVRAINQMPVTKDFAPTILRNTYEAFRMLGEARLSMAGIKSADHDTQLKEVLRLNADTPRPLAILDTLKRARHNINYRGYAPSVEEAEDAADMAGETFAACARKLEQELFE